MIVERVVRVSEGVVIEAQARQGYGAVSWMRNVVDSRAWPLPTMPGRPGHCRSAIDDPVAGPPVRPPRGRMPKGHVRRAGRWADSAACPLQPAASRGAGRPRAGRPAWCAIGCTSASQGSGGRKFGEVVGG